MRQPNYIYNIKCRTTYKCKIKILKKHQKWKELKKENGKVANRKLGKIGNLGKTIPSFLVPSFLFYPTAKSKTRI